MKRLTIVFAVMLCGFFKQVAAQSAAPYVADFSSSFKIGDAKYSDIILNLWKDWDDNQLTRHDYFSDTVTMWMSDGSITRGKAANLEAAKKFRGSFSKAKSTLHAWVPLYSTDVKLDMVGVWGVEEDTYPDGKVESREIHEVWWFNKDGKIAGVRQWAAVAWKN
jgi:hypothetical protein